MLNEALMFIIFAWAIPYFLIVILSTITVLWCMKKPVYIKDVTQFIDEIDPIYMHYIPIFNYFVLILCIIALVSETNIWKAIDNALTRAWNWFINLRIK